ncbi:MAG: oxidoreductase [Vicinamibacterales bacterium]
MTDTATRAAAVRMTTFDTIVLESVVETADTRTLVLDAGSERRPWHAGQYVSIDVHQFPGLRSFVGYLEQAKGRKEAPRAYSMASAPHEPHLAITIKEEVFERGVTKYPPLLSGFLVHHVRAGDRLSVQGFAGPYVLREDVESRAEHVLHLCAGSGSVPDLSIIKDSLYRHSRLRHTMVYSNKTWDDVIFRDELGRLEQANPSRLRVIHTLTRETRPLSAVPNVRSGRVDQHLLRSVLDEEPRSLIYACGPAITVWERRACAAQGTTPTPRFIEAMLSQLAEIGIPRERITVESYG